MIELSDDFRDLFENRENSDGFVGYGYYYVKNFFNMYENATDEEKSEFRSAWKRLMITSDFFIPSIQLIELLCFFMDKWSWVDYSSRIDRFFGRIFSLNGRLNRTTHDLRSVMHNVEKRFRSYIKLISENYFCKSKIVKPESGELILLTAEGDDIIWSPDVKDSLITLFEIPSRAEIFIDWLKSFGNEFILWLSLKPEMKVTYDYGILKLVELEGHKSKVVFKPRKLT